jgi:membrane protease YdiL (CAAX protease family)
MGFGEPSEPSSEILPAAQPEKDLRKTPFLGGNRVISIWKAVAFLFVMIEIAPRVTGILVVFPLNRSGGISPTWFLMLVEFVNFGMLLGVSLLVSRLESRSIGEYGLPVTTAFGRNFWLGSLMGLAEVSILIGLIAVMGGYSFGAFAVQGAAIAGWGLFHLLLFLFVGFYEEFLFRGYAQFALGQGVGFWPAAVILSLLFGTIHLTNGGENWIGAASVATVGLMFAFTLKRTGNLWYAIGLHMSFDWGETFLYSVPNSGELLQGHLSNAVLQGPAWLTGGTVGPEGSVFCFVTMGIQFLVVMWLFPAQKNEASDEAAELLT